MSCFVVASETLDKVVALALASDLVMLCGVDLNRPDAGTMLGRKLWQLNVNAFQVCYQGRHCDDLVDPETYTYANVTDRRTLGRVSLQGVVARYKALSCLTYQLMEDPVDKSADFAELEALEAATAKRIVGNLPEYDRAPWG